MVYNHSSSPNAEWEIQEEDNRFVRFFALEEIKQGEEILHDYGVEYWESRK
jgi:SET domain-containing protein